MGELDNRSPSWVVSDGTAIFISQKHGPYCQVWSLGVLTSAVCVYACLCNHNATFKYTATVVKWILGQWFTRHGAVHTRSQSLSMAGWKGICAPFSLKDHVAESRCPRKHAPRQRNGTIYSAECESRSNTADNQNYDRRSSYLALLIVF